MSVKLRFRRMGRKKHPIYALVATDARSPRDGRFIEDLGRYEPVAEPARVSLKAERILYWLGQGAQPSDTVRNLLSKEGLMLRLHLTRKGQDAEAIEAAVAEFTTHRAEKKAAAKTTTADRRRAALEAEKKQAAEDSKRLAEERKAREAELERQRQENEDAERATRAAADAEAAAAASAPEGGADADTTTDLEAQVNVVHGGGEGPLDVPADEAGTAGDESTGEKPHADGMNATAPEPDDAAPATEEAADAPPAGDTAAAETSEGDTVDASSSKVEVESAHEQVSAPASDLGEGAPDAAQEQPAVSDTPTATADVAADSEDQVVDQASTAAAESTGADAGEPVASEPSTDDPVSNEAAATDEPAKAPRRSGRAAKESGDDLTRIVGIGPVFAKALHASGIQTFAQLAEADLDALRGAILEHSKGSEAGANEETWAAQAALAVAGDWDGVAAYSDRAPEDGASDTAPADALEAQAAGPTPDDNDLPTDPLGAAQAFGERTVNAEELATEPGDLMDATGVGAPDPLTLVDPEDEGQSA